mmetsp:Transcript_45894/g.103652  ORF Transcript_45894/g.103652 Transcript_45894/m.103652 type:complete len:84 (+) Transcript_45894:87-338(+)|eukprot:CAMPEP_0172644922 /NCGR_PEP_ID=MMETSP1068-20121228/239464_1 /TAXON_ID=35684 /ORGANISM="Pseudopedinella elastica, Strain CCMP716" /LENGTH=83 /DNA_ID=CAMNT_0013459143 /DNA_START=80 /DNA_END=331 /DNA_ORIENTATION=+
MQNEAGDLVDLYIPRKCSWTNRLIQSKDKASVQLNVAEIDESGRFNGDVKTYAIAGYVRDHSESDSALWHLISKGTKQASSSP